KVPGHYIRKQTLKNQERYITPPLKEHEDKVLRAEERSIALEKELFNALRDRVARECTRLQATAEVLAEIDVYVALALLAVSRRYCRPVLCDEPVLDIREGRHPVLDKLQPTGQFVPNDIRLGCGGDPAAGAESGGSGRLQIITGPNMAGKSTYIRQAALLVVMAQLGSFVPATSARIGLADRIFARVGASDELGKGQSTFMVEMTETARILNAATPKSLVILDEIGRGTSTYDGVSLAWAVTEYLHDALGSRTMFATHYHELTALAARLPRLQNATVKVKEWQGEVVFLHEVGPGAADRSYGIQVAKLAGLPPAVIARAQDVLSTLEAEDRATPKGFDDLPLFAATPRAQPMPEADPAATAVKTALEALSPDDLSPREALEALYRLKGTLARRD
ncbi:MAG: DNA mismatch repair protein MutS, partial [Pseudolabrys sp.]|nr:DNA mismatch repair protein MutS [Pseudolabrys sp.]